MNFFKSLKRLVLLDKNKQVFFFFSVIIVMIFFSSYHEVFAYTCCPKNYYYSRLIGVEDDYSIHTIEYVVYLLMKRFPEISEYDAYMFIKVYPGNIIMELFVNDEAFFDHLELYCITQMKLINSSLILPKGLIF